MNNKESVISNSLKGMQEIVVKYLIAVRLNGLSSCAVWDSSKQISNKTDTSSACPEIPSSESGAVGEELSGEGRNLFVNYFTKSANINDNL